MKGKIPLRAALIVFIVLLVATCQQPSPPTPPAKYVLTVEGVNCGTTPSGSVSVEAGVATSIRGNAPANYMWPASGAWTVVTGTALIANPNSSMTTVTLNAGDATVRASCIPVYKLTVQSDGSCLTNPSGEVSVGAGVPTTVSITMANVGHIWSGNGTWTVVSGTALIANPNAISTTVTLNSGDATIQASIP